jgi:hypothetical protein
MKVWWPVRAMTQLWDWSIPGLIALEPAAMGLYVALGETASSPQAPAGGPTGLARNVKDLAPSQTDRSQRRVEGFGK